MLVTIAICTRNRVQLLLRLLKSLERVRPVEEIQTEILICDNNSTDKTRDAVSRLRSTVRLLVEPRQGKSYALLQLIREARGDWIIFLDDDVTVAEDWLAGYSDAMHRYPQGTFFGGRILPEAGTQFKGMKAYMLRTAPAVHGVVTSQEDLRLSPHTTADLGGGNLAVRRDAIAHPSTESLLRQLADQSACCEDFVLMLDHLRRGGQAWLLTGPTVYHHVPPERAGLIHFWRWWYGRGRSLRRIPGGFPPGVSLRRFVVLKRLRILRQNLAGARVGPLVVTLLSIAALGTGFLTQVGRRR